MVGPDYARPEPILPESFRLPKDADASQAQEARLEDWWLNFQDPKLTDLMDRAMQGNLSLQRAAASIGRYRAMYGISYSQLYPSLNAQAGYSYQLLNFAELGGQTSSAPFETWRYGVAMSTWEVDLFGKIRRGMQAAQARLQASIEGYRLAMVSLRAEVASAYLSVRTLQAQRDLARENVDLYEQVFVITEAKFKASTTSQMELSEAAARLATARAVVPLLEAQLQERCNGLSVLLGEAAGPMQDELLASAPIPLPDGEVSIGIPGDLLRRRADVLQMERELMAATAEIGVAETGYYPQLSINGTWQIAAVNFSGLGDISNQTYGVGPSFSWNFFNAGLTASQVRQAEALAREMEIQWRETVLKAASEVQTALGNYAGARAQLSEFEKTLLDVQDTYELALARYRAGTVNLTQLLQFAQTVLEAENGYAQARGLAASNLVELYRSLGGGWENVPIPAVGEGAFSASGPNMFASPPPLPDGNTPSEKP
jgi:NodT family efflux transporter outer membrane factor (OMF) lipoprotein